MSKIKEIAFSLATVLSVFAGIGVLIIMYRDNRFFEMVVLGWLMVVIIIKQKEIFGND